MADTFGSLIFEINANVNQLIAESKKAQQSLKEIGDRSGEVENKLVSFGKKAGVAIAAAFSVAKLKEFAEESLKLGEALSDGAKKAGIQAGAFSQMAYAAKMSNVDINDLSMSFKSMQINIAKGGKEFAQFGIDLEDLRRKEPDQQFRTLADAVARIEDPARRAEAAVELFGKQGANLLPMLSDGARGIRQLQEEAVRLNIAMSDEQIKSLADAQDAVDKLKFRWEAFAAVLTSKVAFAIEAVASGLSSLGAEADPLDVITDEIAKLEEKMPKRVSQVEGGFVKRDISELQGPRAFPSMTARPVRQSAAEKKQKELIAERDKILAERRQQELDDRGALAEIDLSTLPKRKPYNAELAKWEQEQREPFGKEQNAQLQSDEAKAFSDMAAEQQKEFDKRFESEREALQRKLNQVREFAETEDQEEIRRQQERLETLKQSLDSGLLIDEEYQTLREESEKEHADRLKSIRERNMTDLEKFSQASFGSQVKTAVGAFQDITAGISRESKAAFELNKLAGLANVALKIPEAVQNAYTWGNAFGGPPAGAAAAAIAFAASVANLQAIQKQKFGSGSAPSLGGSTSAPPVTPVGNQQQATQGQVITVEGLAPEQFITGKMARALFAELQDVVRDGGVVQYA